MITGELPTNKAESLYQFKVWLAKKHNLTLQQFDEFLQHYYDITLKDSLSENWNWCELGYLYYVLNNLEEDLKEDYLND